METLTRNPEFKQQIQPKKRYARAVKAWLIAGLVMIFVQVVVGGITRLTGSGLSITRWEIVTGTLPPLNAEQWEEAFDLYKATPQYEKINEGMSLSDFKFIYFWEYVHRLWARLMGFVFIIPFGIFWYKGMLGKSLLRRLGVVFLLASLVASFGWIMVASGLIDRPWVNAYKLTMHLSLAVVLFSYLLWTTFEVIQNGRSRFYDSGLKKLGTAFILVLALQIILGGTMSGMKAGLNYPTWPDMNGEAIPAVLLDAGHWNAENFVNYDASAFMPALVQVLHRTTAYLLTVLGLWFFVRSLRAALPAPFRINAVLLAAVLAGQVLLGILTLVNSVGIIPVGLGVMHQAGALLLLTTAMFQLYLLGGNRGLKSNYKTELRRKSVEESDV